LGFTSAFLTLKKIQVSTLTGFQRNTIVSNSQTLSWTHEGHRHRSATRELTRQTEPRVTCEHSAPCSFSGSAMASQKRAKLIPADSARLTNATNNILLSHCVQESGSLKFSLLIFSTFTLS
jgi:hypothetical protein